MASTHHPYAQPSRGGSVPSPNTMGGGAGTRASGSSQSTRSSTATTSLNPLSSSHMESTVTRLLVATKQLLESLTDWSQGRIDEGCVSDIYVRLGNEFNAASLAFSKEGIDMVDLNSVPDDLRTCLEAALSEEASPATLDQHLPQIRQIVVHLLQGLKSKQSKWRAARRQQEHELAQHPPSSAPSSRPGPSRDMVFDRPAQSPVVRMASGRLSHRSREDLRRVVVGSAPSTGEFHKSNRGSAPEDSRRRPSIESQDPNIKPRLSPVGRAVRSVNDLTERIRGSKSSPPPPPPPPPPPMPNFAHSSQTPSSAYPEVPIPPVPRSPRSEQSNQAQASSLEALRKADLLQRRASKRFSTYTYNKIAHTASPSKRSVEGQIGLGLGVNIPALPRTPSSLALLGSQDEAHQAQHESAKDAPKSNRSEDVAMVEDTMDTGHNVSVLPSNTLDPAKPKIDSIYEESETSINHNLTPDASMLIKNPNPSPTKLLRSQSVRSGSAVSISEHPTVFLQLGREVKKVKLDSRPTIASLRVLFMDRFQYNPGAEDFPAIYVRDAQSGVQYQLEDLSEVKDRVVLSLNIDALDQVKSHIDSGLSGLAREIKDLKTAVTNLRRQSIPASATSGLNALKVDTGSISPGSALRPRENQFKNAARQILQQVRASQQPLVGEPPGDATASTPSAAPETSPTVVNSAVSMTDQRFRQLSGTFKNQFNEVQELRRDLGILRQVYSTFTGETRSMIVTLRSQTDQVRQVASTKVSASRTFIDAGKSKLESRSQDLVTKIESLQDTVEDLKQDVTTRKMRPKPSAMSSVSESIKAVEADLEDLTNHITTIKPSWKKSWEDELQNIVDEQQLLNYQEDLVKDLKEDLDAVSNLFGHVRDYLDARKASKVKPKDFIGITTSIGSHLSSNPREGLDTVLMQVKALSPDVDSRLKAIEAAEKLRAKNLKEVGDDDQFAKELAGFVGSKKLKMTGGTEEIERMRNLKSEQTLKAMLLNTGTNSGEVETPAQQQEKEQQAEPEKPPNSEKVDGDRGDVGDPKPDESAPKDVAEPSND